MLGNSDDVNRANAQTAEEVHVAWHEVTRLERTRDVLNEFFLPMFGRTADGREFDFDDPTPTSSNEANDELTAKASAAAQLIGTQVFDPQDVLEVVGLPSIRVVGPGMLPGSAPGSVRTTYNPDIATDPDPDNLNRQALVWAADRIAEMRSRRPSVSDAEALVFGRMMLESMEHQNGNGHRKEVTA